jgi:hypothetical protein
MGYLPALLSCDDLKKLVLQQNLRGVGGRHFDGNRLRMKERAIAHTF